MGKPTVDELLSGSGPSFAPSVATEEALDALVLETKAARVERRTSRRRRALWLVPGVFVAVGALTAGAVVVEQYLSVDVPIAIEYTTDTGVTVACTAHVGASFFAPKGAEVIEYYQTHDFSGLGQQVYDYALVLHGERPSTPDVLPKSFVWHPSEVSEAGPDGSAFVESLLDFLVLDVILEFGLEDTGGEFGGSAGLETNCQGELH